MVKRDTSESSNSTSNKRQRFTEKTTLVFEQVIAESIKGIVEQFSRKDFDNKYFSELYSLQPLPTLLNLRSIIDAEIQKKEGLNSNKRSSEE